MDHPFPRMILPGSGWVPSLPPPVLPDKKWLAVLIPKGDCTRFELEAIGLRLRDWQLTDPGSGHIWGLDDLLSGRRPRTPPFLPLTYECSPDAHEPVALVCTADTAPGPETLAALEAALRDLTQRVVVMDLPTYIAWQH